MSLTENRHCPHCGAELPPGWFVQDQMPDADPAKSKVRLVCEVRYHEKVIPEFELEQHLRGELGRCICQVTSDIFPQKLAYDFWQVHRPWDYYRSGLLFEDLFRSAPELNVADDAPAYLARAMVAYWRSLAFDRCANLAKELPTISKKAQKNKHFPPSETLESLVKLLIMPCETTPQVGDVPG